MKQVIEILKHQTKLSTKLGGAEYFLGIFENLFELYQNAAKAGEDYAFMMTTAETLGAQNYHGWALRGSGNPASGASCEAFEHAVAKSIVGTVKMKTDMVDFSRAIGSETEARNWGSKLRAETSQLQAELKSAQETLKHHAMAYAIAMVDLATKYKLMLPHQAKLLKTWKALNDYEKEHYGKLRSSILSSAEGYLKVELRYYDEAIAKARVRLAIPAAMSKSHSHAH